MLYGMHTACDRSFRSLPELYQYTLERIIVWLPHNAPRALVFGPIRADSPMAVQENLAALETRALALAELGYAVLDLVSFRPTYLSIVEDPNTTALIDDVTSEFTVQLIRSGRFTEFHFHTSHHAWEASSANEELHAASQVAHPQNIVYF